MIAKLSHWLSGHKALIQRVAVFGILGVIVNVIYVCLFSFLNWVDSSQRFLWATVAYCAACAFQYAANAVLTFDRKVLDAAQFLRYCASIFFGYAFSTVLLVYVAPRLGLADVLAMLMIIVSLAVFNYLFFSQWVYARGSSETRCL